MSQLRCLRAELLLERRAAGLSAADALRLEEHLADCEHCTAQARTLDSLRSLLDQLDTTLVPAARERAIAGALAGAAASPSGAQPHGWLRPQAWLPALAFGVALGAVLAIGLRQKQAVAPIANAGMVATGSATASRSDRVLSGNVEFAGRVSAVGSALSATATNELLARGPAMVALAQAQVELRAGTRLRWHSSERVIQLEAGSVVADVDPGAHQSFTVETKSFRVVVLGTRFEVSPEAVMVERGRVRVVDLDGHALGADLGPGERYVFTPKASESAALDAVRSGPSVAVASKHGEPSVRSRVEARAPSVQPELARAKPAEAPATPNVAALLDAARHELGAKRTTDARRDIDAALALAMAPSLRAEALSLRADCALVEGNLAAAIASYNEVAQTYANLPAGENALFAAARLEQDRGQRAAAIAGLQRYLSRYPRGRFVKEAGQRLRELGAEPDNTQ